MADSTTNPILSVCATVGSKVSDLGVSDGQLIFVRDKRKIALDFDGKRTFYNVIEELATDGARTSMLAPVTGSYYFVVETGVLWTYQDGWVQLTSINDNGIYVGDEEPTDPNVCVWIKPDGEVDTIQEQINQLSSEKVDKTEISLGIASDGLIYLFVDGSPVGTGIPQGTSGDVFGYVDENNTIVLTGALADGTYSIKYEMEDESTIDIGNLVLDTNVYYSVTNTLTNCTNSNSAKQIVDGGSYSATISANDGHEISSIKVTMGGTDISSTAVSGGTITIANVTGNIVITAVATEKVVTPSYTNLATTFVEGKRWSTSSGGLIDADGAVFCEDFIPFAVGSTVRIKGMGDLTAYHQLFYLADKTTINTTGKANNIPTHASYEYDSENDIVTLIPCNSNNAYARFNGVLRGTTADIVITVNEPIV